MSKEFVDNQEEKQEEPEGSILKFPGAKREEVSEPEHQTETEEGVSYRKSRRYQNSSCRFFEKEG